MKNRFEVKMYTSKLKCEQTDQLYKAILSLETEEDCYRFFDDLLTVGEIKSFSQRFEVAMLLAKDVTTQQAADETGASTGTVTRVRKCLNYGADGYKLAIERLSKEE